MTDDKTKCGDQGEENHGDSFTASIVNAQECKTSISIANATVHIEHQTIRCRCGCVPNILSLFEMAALRAARKEHLKVLQHD